MKKLHLLALVTLIMVGLSGCEKSAVTDDATADVFIKAITNSQGVTVYAAINSVFSYNKIKSVSVVAPDGTTTQLTNYQNAGNSFYNEPAVTDYLPTIPPLGNYIYTVTFNDETVSTYTNSLSDVNILPPSITLAKNATGDSVYISWSAIANANTYQLKVQSATAQVFYADGLVDNSSPKKATLKLGFLVNSLTSGTGGNYTFTLSGLLYESTDYTYLQAVSSASKVITL
jgi:hypothetical protein